MNSKSAGGKESDLRRKGVKVSRDEYRESTQRRDELIDQKAERAHSEGRELLPYEMEELDGARERASTTAPVGAPPALALYHKWMAVHIRYAREKGFSAEAANKIVCEHWGVTRTAVIEAVKSHNQAALETLAVARATSIVSTGGTERVAVVPEFAGSESPAMNHVWQNIAVMSKSFRDLSNPEINLGKRLGTSRNLSKPSK